MYVWAEFRSDVGSVGGEGKKKKNSFKAEAQTAAAYLYTEGARFSCGVSQSQGGVEKELASPKAEEADRRRIKQRRDLSPLY